VWSGAGHGGGEQPGTLRIRPAMLAAAALFGMFFMTPAA
jgi:hypothetical protein